MKPVSHSTLLSYVLGDVFPIGTTHRGGGIRLPEFGSLFGGVSYFPSDLRLLLMQ